MENAPFFSMVKKWADEFERGMEYQKIDPRQGRPVTVTTHKSAEKIYDRTMKDRLLTDHHVATALGVSKDCIHTLIQNDLQMKLVSAFWVPKLI